MQIAPIKTSTLVLLLALAGCAVTEKVPEVVKDTQDASAKVVKDVSEVTVAPLNDLNLMRAEIPPVLQAARLGPYRLPEDLGCTFLATEIAALDTALGPDLDAPATADSPSLVERGVGVVGKAAVRAVKGVTDGVIPYRSWVRKLSGAEKHAREAAAAITAGSMRRAFLKGVRGAQRCDLLMTPPAPSTAEARAEPPRPGEAVAAAAATAP